MKHRKLTITNGQLFEATHNHDSIGRCLGHVTEGTTIAQCSAAIHAVAESVGNPIGTRSDYMAAMLRDAGLLRS